MIVGTGIDIVEIARIDKAIKRWGDHFLHHVFVDEEIKYARQYKNYAQAFAGRFAAKEAVFKAVLNQSVLSSWRDITILNDPSGKPLCRLNDPSFKHTIFLSISHSDHYAVASAIITTS